MRPPQPARANRFLFRKRSFCHSSQRLLLRSCFGLPQLLDGSSDERRHGRRLLAFFAAVGQHQCRQSLLYRKQCEPVDQCGPCLRLPRALRPASAKLLFQIIPHSTSEPLSVGRTKSVSAGAGLFTNPRIGARSSVRPSAVGGDVCEERLLRRFSPERKAAKQQLRPRVVESYGFRQRGRRFSNRPPA